MSDRIGEVGGWWMERCGRVWVVFDGLGCAPANDYEVALAERVRVLEEALRQIAGLSPGAMEEAVDIANSVLAAAATLKEKP